MKKMNQGKADHTISDKVLSEAVKTAYSQIRFRGIPQGEKTGIHEGQSGNRFGDNRELSLSAPRRLVQDIVYTGIAAAAAVAVVTASYLPLLYSVPDQSRIRLGEPRTLILRHEQDFAVVRMREVSMEE